VQPPTEDQSPAAQRGRSSVVTKRSHGRICPQASPIWLTIAPGSAAAYLKGQSFNFSAAEVAQANSSTKHSVDPKETEVCVGAIGKNKYKRKQNPNACRTFLFFVNITSTYPYSSPYINSTES
jgi:hypothetical protein